MAKLGRLPPTVQTVDTRAVKPLVTAGSGFSRVSQGSSTQRGYGVEWRKLRLQVLAGEPLCRFCTEATPPRVTAATEVDHIVPFNGLNDPLRLDPNNCRPTCAPCHRARTARQASGHE